MVYVHNQQYSLCIEEPADSSSQTVVYPKGAERSSNGLKQHVLIFCKQGHIRVSSNLFNGEFLCAGEILFIPRGSDCHSVALSDSTLLVHYFNNTVCRIENCILSFLFTYKHIEPQENRTYFYSKLTVCGQLTHLMDGINGYLSEAIHEPALWVLKHKELLWLFTKYYSYEELSLFFHPMSDEEIPFKSLVLTNYHKAEYTDSLASMCGYGLHTFRRKFKQEFGISPYKWLSQKRAEHIRHRLSFHYIPFSDIIEEFNFSSQQQFSRFCTINLGDSPSNLRKKYINEARNTEIAQQR